MFKDYLSWHKLKAKIEDEKIPPLFNEREIWWCSLGVNIGFEEDGKNELFERPVLILKKFNQDFFWGLPLTSKIKRGIFYHTFNFQKIRATVILSQTRTLSSKRLVRRLGKISRANLDLVKVNLILLLKTDPLRGPRVPSGNM